ncbi:hypothetical protein QTP70_014630 [Hemibagrus guttatus]|uniref:NADH dehydrogenase [ubiquinone] 1 alpha subcomplex assembly factor 3 n=1 Tax=Hemibagrus guttatus TaxID=175788 RepID=A0AAE0Q308_9TELE|nr:hypothetical protein QTP70_014630 [Hemibagrus guttatus]
MDDANTRRMLSPEVCSVQRGNVSPVSRRTARPVLTRGHRLGPTDDEMYQRTTVTVMQKEPGGGPIIYSYSSRGFNIDGNKVIGPCAWFLRLFYSGTTCPDVSVSFWQVGSHEDITVESLALFYLLEPRIGTTTQNQNSVLVLGTGARTERLDPNVLSFIRKKGIAVEVQDTPNACATFNFLTSERRITAAALIPPPLSSAVTSE